MLTINTVNAVKTIDKSRMFFPAQSINKNLWKIAKEYPSLTSEFSITAANLEVAVSIK
ncbi:hypothetical protein [Flavobacterium adhaerens]|uniref:hypothetical protein n=1 Tax=Flavobacterium adhaerens TaxID=3149043 RepID=UPI0032B3D4F4